MCVVACPILAYLVTECVYVCCCLSVNVCVCVCVCVCVTTCLCDHLHAFVCDYVWVFICFCVFVFVCVCVCVCVCVQEFSVYYDSSTTSTTSQHWRKRVCRCCLNSPSLYVLLCRV